MLKYIAQYWPSVAELGFVGKVSECEYVLTEGESTRVAGPLDG